MVEWDGNLEIDKLVKKDGHLHQGADYVCWMPGDVDICLDGHFTVADLRWLADYMSKKQVESAGD